MSDYDDNAHRLRMARLAEDGEPTLAEQLEIYQKNKLPRIKTHVQVWFEDNIDVLSQHREVIMSDFGEFTVKEIREYLESQGLAVREYDEQRETRLAILPKKKS